MNSQPIILKNKIQNYNTWKIKLKTSTEMSPIV